MRKLVVLLALTVAFFGVGAVGIGDVHSPDDAPAATTVDPAALAGVDEARLDQSVATLQQHLADQPRDARGWAGLGLAYIEQARRNGDASLYPKAGQSLRTSLQVQPIDNDTALAGMAALAGARHDFTAALRWSARSLAVNPFQPQALQLRTDALVELGHYRSAQRAARRADSIQPSIGTFSRLAYLAELRGHHATARSLLSRAADDVRTGADAAFLNFHLAELARRDGDLRAAAAALTSARRASPESPLVLIGEARLALARGDIDKALRRYSAAVGQLPLTEYLVEYGELALAIGRPELAQAQFEVARAAAQLARSGGVAVNVETALFEADHGNPDLAITAARAEWRRRHSVFVADALGWALHAAGRDAQALPYARRATALGTRDPLLLYHRGAIEHALGRRGPAKRHLRAALAADPAFAPLHAAAARDLLRDLSRRPAS